MIEMSGLFSKKRFLFSLSPKIEKNIEKYLTLFCLILIKGTLKNGPIFWMCFFPAWIQVKFKKKLKKLCSYILVICFKAIKQNVLTFNVVMACQGLCCKNGYFVLVTVYWSFENKLLSLFCSQLCCFSTNFQKKISMLEFYVIYQQNYFYSITIFAAAATAVLENHVESGLNKFRV